jgi:integrase
MRDVGLAHSRIEVLDRPGLPSVEIWVGAGTRFEHWNRFVQTTRPGISSQRSKARSVGYFIDFIAALGWRYSPEHERAKLFPDFADALRYGTIAGGEDETGLWWSPRRVGLTQRVVREVIEFTDWLANDAGLKPINPVRGATLAEEMSFWRAWQRRTDRALLKHLKSASRSERASKFVRSGVVRGRPPRTAECVKAFPEEAFCSLITTGFARSPRLRWTTLRDICIALLMHGGALRLSEALQLWGIDIFDDPHDPDGVVVRVFHPSEGAVTVISPDTGRQVTVTREAYLATRYGIRPRTQQPRNSAVGWKDPLLDNPDQNYLQVYWRDPLYAKLFREAFCAYMACRPLISTHPFLFVTDSTALRPMGIKAYEKVHAAAVRRIGLTAAKHLGTTPHGHRHATGKALAAAKLPRKVIMKMLHHSSDASQDVYTQPTILEIQKAVREADGLAPGFSERAGTHEEAR